MDYKKKYEDLVSKIEKAYLFTQTDSTKAALEEIRPELKESDDEKIRKELIQLISYIPDADHRKKDWITWLEKQKILTTEEYLQGKEDVLWCIKQAKKHAKDENEMGTCWFAEKWLEKQGKQETDEWKEGNIIRHGGILAIVIKGRRAMKSNGEIFTVQYPDEWVKASPNEIEYFLNEFEKQSEKKPTIFIPKFRVGDKLVSTKNPRLTYEVLEVGHINELGNQEYKVEIFTDGKANNPRNIHYMSCHKVDEWAKLEPKFHEGDKIHCKLDDRIFVIKEVDLKNGVYIYTENGRGNDIDYADEMFELVEQKSTDNKVDPKFHVGDWITNGIETVQFAGYDVDYGYQVDYEGNLLHRDTDIIEKEYRLWNINDAKDGDMLVDEDNNIGIYKGKDDIDWDSYIYLGCDGELRGFSIGGRHEQTDTHPATKEQRDALEKAMSDAGYTFDFDKKELKKNHTEIEECKIEHIEHGKYYYCIKDYFCGGKKQASKGDVVQALRGMSIMALGAKANEYFLPVKFIKYISAWSEEDERNMQSIDSVLFYDKKLPEDICVKLRNFLKSLKQRIGG